MSDAHLTHWTTDEDVLERYVQGRLTGDQRSSLDEHLRACAQCRERVDLERALAGGVRAAGRKQLRRELADRLARRTAAGTAGVWRWMAAAAILVAAVGTWRLLTPVGSSPTMPPAVSDNPATAPEAAVEQPVPSPAPASTTGGTARDRRRERLELALPLEERRPTAAPSAGAGVTMAEASRDGMVHADAMVEAKMQRSEELSDVDAPDPRKSWVLASVLQPVRELASKALKAEEAGRAKETREADAAIAQTQTLRGPMAMQLRQAPRADLPEDQRVVASSRSRSIPALLTLVGDSLRIEIYPATPFSDRELSAAVIVRPAQDSVVVVVGPLLLGFRLPAEFLAR